MEIYGMPSCCSAAEIGGIEYDDFNKKEEEQVASIVEQIKKLRLDYYGIYFAMTSKSQTRASKAFALCGFGQAPFDSVHAMRGNKGVVCHVRIL